LSQEDLLNSIALNASPRTFV